MRSLQHRDSSATRLCFATSQFYPTYGGSQQRYLGYLPGFREFAGPRYDTAQTKKSEFRDRVAALLRDPAAAGRVHFVGIVDDVPRYLQAADICVLASKLEGMPNSVLEAMGCGVPVIMTRFAGMSDDLGRPNREYRLAERNPEALASALSGLLDAPGEREALGANGLAWVSERLPFSASVKRHVDLYEELVATPVSG